MSMIKINVGKYFRSVVLRVPALTIASVLVATLAVTAVTHLFEKNTMKETLQAEQWARIQSIAQSIDAKFANRIVTLQIVAEGLPKSIFNDPQSLQKYLVSLHSLREAFDNVSIIDVNGDLVANLNNSKPIGKLNISDREYFKSTLQTSKAVISKPYINRYNGLPQVAVTQPVLDHDGNVVYVLSGSLNLQEDTFLEEFYHVKFGKTGYMFIMNSNGTLISHPDKKRIMTLVNGTKVFQNAPVAKALAGFEGTMVATSSYGVNGLYVYKRISSTDWILGGIYPTDEAYESIDKLGKRAVFYCILLSIVLALIAAILTRRQLRPLVILRETMSKDAQAPLRASFKPLFRMDEFGEIANGYYEVRDAYNDLSCKLLKSEQHLRDILTHAGDAFVGLDADGSIIEWNRQAERTFGWAQDEVVGKKLENVLIPLEFQQAHANGLKRFADSGTGDVINKLIELPALHKNGHTIAVELSVASSFNGTNYVASAFLRDITGRKEAETKLHDSEKLLRTVTDNIPILIGYAGMDELYKFANAGYRRFLGVEPEAVLGMSMREIMGPKSYAEIEPHIQTVKRGEPVHFERHSELKGKTVHFMGDYIPDFDSKGVVRGFFILVLDISERKEAEIARERSQKLAESASKAKSEFVANMSHELRTPMNAVLGVTQILARSSLTSEQRRDLTIIRTAGQSLLSILNNILDFSKLEAGMVEVSVAPFHLNEVIRNVGAIMSVNAGESEINLVIGVESDVPLHLIGDATRLQQILINLTGNAIKFTSRGSVSLLLDRQSNEKHALLRFRVQDTGIGITEEQRKRLFSPFSQADSSTTRQYGGTGLGLTISKNLVELLGGQINVHSIPGSGSEFSFSLPFEVVNDNMPNTNDNDHNSKLRILVVDDSSLSLEYLVKMIHSWNWNVDTASSLDDAVRTIQVKNGYGIEYDFALIDWKGGGRSGIEVVNLIQKYAGDIPVVLIVNGKGRSELGQESSPPQSVLSLTRPVTASNLFDTVQENISKDNNLHTRRVLHEAMEKIHARILLVEDNLVNQFVATNMLRSAGITVNVVNNGKEAVDLLREGKNQFDLILMDVQMPVMDGYEATRIIRQDLKMELPILAMTAGVMEDEIKLCHSAGMDGFIGKPVEYEQLIATIVSYVPQN